jgi:hypothetical protein
VRIAAAWCSISAGCVAFGAGFGAVAGGAGGLEVGGVVVVACLDVVYLCGVSCAAGSLDAAGVVVAVEDR